MRQTHDITQDDLIALYLKYNRIEWALVACTDQDIKIIVDSEQFVTNDRNPIYSHWHNGVKV